MKTYQKIKLGIISTSKSELIDISKAWIIISLAFAFVFSDIRLLGGSILGIFSINFLQIFLISLVTAGLGFLLHELGHKFVAQRYGCVAEFRAFDQMLYLALGLAALVGFIFAAPGAVMISGQITRRENGIISLAGPVVNFVLGLIFLAVGYFYSKLVFLTSIGFMINMWLGLFNMIPFGNFDGKKIFEWNPSIWIATVGIGVYLLFFL